MLYLNGCFAGAAALRVAKDLAENNRGARVLVVCAELTVLVFTRPVEGHFQTLVKQCLFGDGAGAVIVGADPVTTTPAERPLFEIVSATQTIISKSEDAITMHLTKGGCGGNISTRQVPVLIGDNIERCLLDAFQPLGIGAGWNDLFWELHPGSSAILDQVEAVLQLEPEKLAASRLVLSEYGNMQGVTVIFVLDELRRRMEKGEEDGAPEWGVMVAFGPGLTVETMVLHRCVAQATGARMEKGLSVFCG
jgi:bisdemethoxycurcumin synthase